MELTESWVSRAIPQRDSWGHKGTFGKVWCICGSVGFTGAPWFASEAAVRSGSGLVYLGVPKSIWEVEAVKCQSAMPFPLPDAEGRLSLDAEPILRDRIRNADAVLIGCGLGRSRESDSLTRRLLNIDQPLVLDADGINALSDHVDRLNVRRGKVTILTPHEGEFSRIGTPTGNREKDASSFAVKYGVYVVLKGHRTVIAAPDGRVAVNTTGNCGMAKGGSGDVLSGMILSFLGQHFNAFEACCCAVWLHGLAGDLAKEEKGEYGMTPVDLMEKIPVAIRKTVG